MRYVQGVANAVWACGELRHHPGPLVDAVLSDLQRRGEEYRLKDWSLLLWGFTSVGEDTREILQMMESKVRLHDLPWHNSDQTLSSLRHILPIIWHRSTNYLTKLYYLSGKTLQQMANLDKTSPKF
jgi:hypothetical protein